MIPCPWTCSWFARWALPINRSLPWAFWPKNGDIELNPRVLESLQISSAAVSEVTTRERVEIERRLERYRRADLLRILRG